VAVISVANRCWHVRAVAVYEAVVPAKGPEYATCPQSGVVRPRCIKSPGTAKLDRDRALFTQSAHGCCENMRAEST
jgi:hypothetical protein